MANSSVADAAAVAVLGPESSPTLVSWILAGVVDARIVLIKIAIIILQKKCTAYPLAAISTPTTLRNNAQLTSEVIYAAWNTGIDTPIAYSFVQVGLAVSTFSYIILGIISDNYILNHVSIILYYFLIDTPSSVPTQGKLLAKMMNCDFIVLFSG